MKPTTTATPKAIIRLYVALLADCANCPHLLVREIDDAAGEFRPWIHQVTGLPECPALPPPDDD